jgi:trk system potassium uptake protein TrkA
MKVIIVGLGPLGRRLAEELSGRRGVELVLLDRDEATCKAAADRYDALVLQGDGTNPELLAKAGAADAQALVATTGSDAMNTVVALLAKQAGTQEVVVVLNDLALRTACQAIGVDKVVSPVLSAASEIQAFILGKKALDFSVAVSGGARVVELEPGPFAGKKLGEIPLPKGVALPVIVREGRALVPEAGTTLRQNDVLVVVAEDEKRLEAVRSLFNPEQGMETD